LLSIKEDISLIKYIIGQIEALEDLANCLEQAFINSIALGSSNGLYWAWFIELKCIVELVKLIV
ncbi:hypothetical protein FOC4_g10000019, partial [Fusarium odoratissimum]